MNLFTLCRVNHPGCPHLPGKFKPILTQVTCNNMTGTGKAGNGHCHAADESCPRYQHIFTQQRECQCRMGGIAERVHDCRPVVRNSVVEEHDIPCRYFDIFGK